MSYAAYGETKIHVGENTMTDSAQRSEAKRALLERYVRGVSLQNVATMDAIPRRTPGSVVPLSVEQRDLWRLARAAPDIPVYRECVTLRLPGPLDVAALEQSFSEIIRRHEAWRTSFPLVDGTPVQRIHPPRPIRLPLVDLCALPAPAREAEAVQIASADAQAPFDLSSGPLLHATLVRLDDAEHWLFLTLHYIIFDGITLYHVLLPELRALYEAAILGNPSSLAPLPIQPADYALWQREWLQGTAAAEQLAFWGRQLSGAQSFVALPTDYPRPAISSYRGAMHPFALSPEITDALKLLSRREGVTLFMTLLAAFGALLHCMTGQDDMLIGTKTAGRKRAEVRNLMGYFLHIVPLRINLADNPTFQELMQRAREVTVGGIAHEDVSLHDLLEVLREEPDASQATLFPVMLTVEPRLPTLPSGWTITQMDVDTQTAKCDLYLELDDRPEGLVGRFEYSTDLFRAATIAHMADLWQRLLVAVATNPSQRLSELPLTT
jgi:surfactin family lipopeptide synthetase A